MAHHTCIDPDTEGLRFCKQACAGKSREGMEEGYYQWHIMPASTNPNAEGFKPLQASRCKEGGSGPGGDRAGGGEGK